MPFGEESGQNKGIVINRELIKRTALIRWPPMGRKKLMMDGALHGRNELIQHSIYKDTGISRSRKQVSSHIQVLKPHVKEQPGGKQSRQTCRSPALSESFPWGVARDR